MTASTGTDLISDALQQVRLSGAVLFRVSIGSPWCFLTAEDAQLSHPARHVAIFHVVLEGNCRVAIGQDPELHLRAGDAVILPRADAHALGDRIVDNPRSVRRLLGDIPLSRLRDVRWQEKGSQTRLLCGFLSYERAAFAPLFDALPKIFRVRLGEGDAGPSLDPLLRYAEQEIVSRRAGSKDLRLRMSELLFVESLRRYMDGLDPNEVGWLAAVRDPMVGRALVLLHEYPQKAWTVTTLAAAVASSRSALAERFQTLLNEPPIHYLHGWRMLLASRYLREGTRSIESIAEKVGYASPAAFQRGFKKHFGIPAGAWRRKMR